MIALEKNQAVSEIAGPVLFPFTGAGVGGSHISTFTLARELTSDFGLRTIVLALENSSVAEEATRMGLEVHPLIGVPARSGALLEDAKRLGERRSLLQLFGPGAILHCNDLWSLQSWGMAAKMLGLPIIYHHRILPTMGWPNRLRLKLANHVICISDACRANLDFIEENRVTSILNPFADYVAIDRQTGRAELEQLWQTNGPVKLIGFAANFQKRKRAEFFLDVCRAVSEMLPDARFVMFGRSRDVTVEQLQLQAENLGIRDKVFFAGFRSPPELNLAPLDVLVAPAMAEPFGRTLVESILVGTPYVATDDAGHTEIHSRWGGGTLVEPSGPAGAFAADVAKIVAEPERFRIPRDRLGTILAELSPRTHAQKVYDIYRQILN